MRRLDAYARIAPGEAARLAAGAIAGIMADRRRRAERAVEAYRRRTATWWWGRPRGSEWCTAEEARRRLEALCRRRTPLADPEYEYWLATNCLHADDLRAAKALSDAAGSAAKKGGEFLINPEDLAELRAWATAADGGER